MAKSKKTVSKKAESTPEVKPSFKWLGLPFLITFLVVFVEFQFNLVEVALGGYLASKNEGREKLGRIYTLEEKNISAQGGLESIFEDLEREREEIESSEGVDKIKEILNNRGDIVLSKSKFLSIYNSIPKGLSARMIQPFDLLEFVNDSNWNRTFIQKRESVKIYLVDENNRVLKSFPLMLEDFNLIRDFEKQAQTTLENSKEYEQNIYEAQEFLRAFNSLPTSYRQQIINNPFKLIEWGENLKTVGISSEVQNGTREVAFEVKFGSQTLVHKFLANTKAIDFLLKEFE